MLDIEDDGTGGAEKVALVAERREQPELFHDTSAA
jgi:hypothetical protein